MTARKPPKQPEERLVRWAQSMTPGAVGGRVASASPNAVDLSGLAARMRARPGAPGVGGVSWQQDDFTSLVTGTPPPTVYTLTYQPVSLSERVYLRTKHLRPGTDYTISGRTLTITSAQTLIAGDSLFADYEYLAQTPVAPSGAKTYVGGSSSTSPNPTLAVPAGIQAGDLMILSARTDGSTTINSPSFTAYATVGAMNVWTRTATGSETSVSITDGGGSFGRLAYILDVVRGGSIQANATATAGGVSPFSTGSIAGGQVNDFVLSIVDYDSGIVDGFMNIPSPLTPQQQAAPSKHDLRSATYTMTAAGTIGPYIYTSSGTEFGWAGLVLRIA